MAARNGNQKIVESLIRAGADVNLSDESGISPLQVRQHSPKFSVQQNSS